MKEFNLTPKKKKRSNRCSRCKKILPKGTKKIEDPFDADVHNDNTKHFLCHECETESSQEI